MSELNTHQEIPSLLPLFGSEDASHILRLDEYEQAKPSVPNEEEEQNPPDEWAVQITFTRKLTEEALWEAFEPILEPSNPEDENNFPSRIHSVGILAEKRMEVPLFVGAVDDLKKLQRERLRQKKKPLRIVFGEVIFVIRLINPQERHFNEMEDNEEGEDDEEGEEEGGEEGEEDDGHFEPEILTEKELRNLTAAFNKAAMKLDKKAKIHCSIEPSAAIRQAENINEFISQFEGPFSIRLYSPQEGWKAQDIWDVMLSLGLEYQNGVFCCETEDVVFSVEILSGCQNVDAAEIPLGSLLLVFHCFIPHCEAPLEAVRVMLRASHYSLKRLGGQLTDDLGVPLEDEKIEAEAKQIIDRLTHLGIPPASPAAFRLFD